jgi:acetylornithine deacetylase/succinyl-diaminopimelate desuccinylase-like protein
MTPQPRTARANFAAVLSALSCLAAAHAQTPHSEPALRSDMSSPAAKAVIAAASKAAGAPVVVMPMSGGSVSLYTFADNFHVPIICLPIVNHDNNQHAANENLRLQNLWDGIDVYASMLAELNW